MRNINERMKILISYDGSRCAGDAIKDLPRAGLPREAEALIVGVQESWVSVVRGSETVEFNTILTNSAAAKPARDEVKLSPEINGKDEKMLEEAAKMLGTLFPAPANLLE